MAAPRLWTQQQAAERLQISVDTVRRLIAKGDILASRIGGQIRIDPAAVESYIARQTMTPVAADGRRKRQRPPALQVVPGISGNISDEDARRIMREARKAAR